MTYTQAQIDKANAVDLEKFLRAQGETMVRSGTEYRWKAHDSLTVYCSQARLVIEIDGGQHYTEEGLAYDKERTKALEKHGLEVIRFTNREVDQQFDAVCQRIDQKIKERTVCE